MTEPTSTHDWWDPGEQYPRLRVRAKDGSIILCCRRCGVNKGLELPTKPCPGVVKVELRNDT